MQFSFAQDKTVTGTVSDALGVLPGVNVLVKGTTRRVTTDFDGKYSIKAKEGEVLVFSFVEMKSTEKTIGAGNNVSVSMQANNILNEVIVGALGIKRTKDATTTLNQVIKTKELTQASNPNVIASLTGKVSGLQINTTSNGVNGRSRIVLRGSRSIGGNNEALVVIDGAISTANALTQLPPEVVESANVIKGAQGSALYGEQGANGVIIVTTKRGSKGAKMTVDLSTSMDFETVAYLPTRQTLYGQGWADDPNFSFGGADPRNLKTFVPWENGAWGPAFTNPLFAGTTVPVGLPQADGKFLFTKWESLGSDNIKSFFNVGNIIQNSVTVNVGGEDSYVLFNAKRETREFIIEGDKLQRTSLLLKAGKRFNKFNIDASLTYSDQSTSQNNSNGLLDDLLQAATNIDVSRFKDARHENNWTVYAFNPYRLLEQNRANSKTNLFNGVIATGYEFNKHISVNYTLNSQVNNVVSDSHNDGINVGSTFYDFTPYGYTYAGAATETYQLLGGQDLASSFFETKSTRQNFYSDLVLNFNYDLTKDLNLKFNLGNNIQDNYFSVSRQGGNNLDVPGFYNIANVLNPDKPTSANLRDFNRTVRLRRVAGFYNIDLGYKDFLFANTTGRLEQTSNIQGKSFFYPSVGLSFLPTKAIESLKDNKILSYAKISGNYTVNGNTTSVPAYDTNAVSTGSAGFPFGDLAGFQITSNPTVTDIRPEIVTTKELNASLQFFDGRFGLDASVYQADTRDLISRVTTSTASGLVNNNKNVGALTNRGFEIDVNVTPLKTKDFMWNLRASYSTFKTTIESLTDDVKSVSLQQNNFIGVFAEVGEEFPLLKGTAYQRSPAGDVIVDANGFPLRTSAFQTLGRTTPDYILNFTNTFNYKGFSLTAVADYRTGHVFFSEQHSRLGTFGYLEESASQSRETGYVVPNSVVQTTPGVYVANTNPVGNGGYSATLNYFSGRYDRTGEAQVLDATTFRIREIALSYSLPSKLVKSAGLQAVRLGVNARNPFIFFGNPFTGKKSNNLGYADPEASNTVNITSPSSIATNAIGFAGLAQYPASKTYGFSLNVTF